MINHNPAEVSAEQQSPENATVGKCSWRKWLIIGLVVLLVVLGIWYLCTKPTPETNKNTVPTPKASFVSSLPSAQPATTRAKMRTGMSAEPAMVRENNPWTRRIRDDLITYLDKFNESIEESELYSEETKKVINIYVTAEKDFVNVTFNDSKLTESEARKYSSKIRENTRKARKFGNTKD